MKGLEKNYIIEQFTLESSQCKEFSKLITSAFLSDEVAKKAGWKGLQTPYIPYFNAQPLKKANFIFFPKKVTLNVANMSNVLLPKKVKSFYFDWR